MPWNHSRKHTLNNNELSSILYTVGVRAVYLVTTVQMTLYKVWRQKFDPPPTSQWKCCPWSDSACNSKQEPGHSMLQTATAGFTFAAFSMCQDSTKLWQPITLEASTLWTGSSLIREIQLHNTTFLLYVNTMIVHGACSNNFFRHPAYFCNLTYSVWYLQQWIILLF